MRHAPIWEPRQRPTWLEIQPEVRPDRPPEDRNRVIIFLAGRSGRRPAGRKSDPGLAFGRGPGRPVAPGVPRDPAPIGRVVGGADVRNIVARQEIDLGTGVARTAAAYGIGRLLMSESVGGSDGAGRHGGVLVTGSGRGDDGRRREAVHPGRAVGY